MEILDRGWGFQMSLFSAIKPSYCSQDPDSLWLFYTYFQRPSGDSDHSHILRRKYKSLYRLYGTYALKSKWTKWIWVNTIIAVHKSYILPMQAVSWKKDHLSLLFLLLSWESKSVELQACLLKKLFYFSENHTVISN